MCLAELPLRLLASIRDLLRATAVTRGSTGVERVPKLLDMKLYVIIINTMNDMKLDPRTR